MCITSTRVLVSTADRKAVEAQEGFLPQKMERTALDMELPVAQETIGLWWTAVLHMREQLVQERKVLSSSERRLCNGLLYSKR